MHRTHVFLASALLLALTRPALGADAINMELSRLVADDQAVRQQRPDRAGWEAIRAADAARRTRVLAMLAEGSIKAAADYENAALIFQHGETAQDYRLAHSLATVATALEPDRRFAKWLQAATWDRLLISLGRLQWYGTQKQEHAQSGQIVALPIDPEVSNAHRAAMGQPPVFGADPSNSDAAPQTKPPFSTAASVPG